MAAVHPKHEPRPRRGGGETRVPVPGRCSGLARSGRPSCRCPPSPPAPRPARANGQQRCRARRAPAPDPLPASSSPGRGAAGVPGPRSGPRVPVGGTNGPHLPENVSPATVSKSPAKVARHVPSLLMLPSARRAAPRRRWVGARGRRADGSLGFQAARRER